ncbi:MAG: A24 family peptidase [archaeon]|jgi:Flp pilus assembly protein protease CpaA|nr:A24 family peptidase [archaeon]
MIEERYYFLFGLALAWLIFASVQDLRKREVANWLNFSLLVFALAYRGIYASLSDEWMFLVYGLAGAAMFFLFGNLFYYAKLFGGGDAKLLTALGAILPFSSWGDLAALGIGFVVLFFLVGAVYGLCYSFYLVFRNKARFKKEFRKNLGLRWKMFAVPLILGIALWIAGFFVYVGWGLIVFAILFPALSLLLYIYMRAIDVCMIKLAEPKNLTEGDWTVSDIHVAGRVIKKSVHGLSWNEIKLLRKAKKKVLIKDGIPFVPVFLLSFLAMVSFYAILSPDFRALVMVLLS